MRRPRCARPGCNAIGHHRHHVILEQHAHFLRPGFSIHDPRNLIHLCFDCHINGHHGNRRLAVDDLPPETLLYVREALGAYGADYLRRYYR